MSTTKTTIFTLLAALLISCNGQLSPSPISSPPPPSPITDEFVYKWKAQWLNGAGCKPPCWEDITPGVTSLQEMANLLNLMPATKKIDRGANYIQWEFSKKNYGAALSANGSDTILNLHITFDGGYDEQQFSLPEVFEKYGEPVNLQPYSCTDGGCETNLVYPEIGMALTVYVRTSNGGNLLITESSPIVGIWFFVPSLKNYMQILGFQDYAIRNWNGFGTYSQ